jgi:dTDP-4-dehydrorhamnose reductase
MVDDQSGSPTWARALAEATAELLRRRELITRRSGVYHLTASGHASRFEFANDIIRIMKDVSGPADGWAKVRPITTGEYPLPARRPRNPVMSKDKVKRTFGIQMAHWEHQLRSCLAELGGQQ